ncbi:MAG: hypothetical protein JO281_04045 [Pseudonocardiales bacterium]|nr:hypothetical protein [Pseudonocardiales bacterium]
MMDLVTLILVLTLTENVTRLSIALARWLESSAQRTGTVCCHGAPTQRRGRGSAR